MLGAPPAVPSTNANAVIEPPPPGQTRWVEVISVELQTPIRDRVAGFAIDSPRPGDSARGAGIEVNGWVIGRDAPVQGVRVVSDGFAGRLSPLDVRRPDVGVDYPEFPHADRSGFSVWSPLPSRADAWHFTLEAILASGDTLPLTDAHCRSLIVDVAVSPGTRAVTAPDFVIIGTQRGGTTSLHAYLAAHPRVIPAAAKELHFLTDRHERGAEWYLGQFPEALPFTAVTGESTPYALFHPRAPKRLYQIAPKAKLIALLRNPIERAHSHFLMERARGDESLEFAAAIEAEAERLAGEEASLANDLTAVSHAHKHASYLARGDYLPQLERWFDVFPRDQVLVLRSEDLYARTRETFAQVATFLGIDASVEVPFAVHNRSTGATLDPDIRLRLAEHFAPLNSRLARFLGRDPEWT